MALSQLGRATALALIKELPLYQGFISAGFPSPTDDFIEERIDLNQKLVPHPAATYFLRVSGDSMRDAGIFSGDLIIVDCSLKPKHGNIVVAAVNGDLTLKRLEVSPAGVFLIPENDAYSKIQIKENDDFTIWGVVTHSIHQQV